MTATAADATLARGKVGDPFSSAWRRRLPLLPALLYIVAITQLPFLVSIYYSLTNLKDKTQSLIPEPTKFVGFENYRRIFSDLSVEENLLVGGGNAGGRSVARVYEHFPALGRMARRRGGSLSGGEQQMLTVARTLMGSPRLLLLDEPSEGLAPVIVQALGQQIAALKREGLTIVLSEQNLKFAARLADRAYIIEKGQIRWDGTMARLMEDEAVRRAYLTV